MNLPLASKLLRTIPNDNTKVALGDGTWGAGGGGNTSKVAVPDNTGSPGAAGQWAIGGGFLYIYDDLAACWVRVACAVF